MDPAAYIWGTHRASEPYVPTDADVDVHGTVLPRKIMDANIIQVSSGHNFVALLDSDGKLYIASDNEKQVRALTSDAPLEKGENGMVYACLDLAGMDAVEVACGDYHVVVLTNTSEVFAWGPTSKGRLGIGETDQKRASRPTQVLVGEEGSEISSISCGASHSAAIASGELYVWGDNSRGQLGLGSSVKSVLSPTHLATKKFRGIQFSKVVCGKEWTFALSENGNLYAWGDNSFGHLGVSSPQDVITRPHAVLTDVSDIACGERNTVVIRGRSVLTCGDARRHLLGRNVKEEFDAELKPVISARHLIAPTERIGQVSVGVDGCFVSLDSGRTLVWGSFDSRARLGMSGQEKALRPVIIPGYNIASSSSKLSTTVIVHQGPRPQRRPGPSEEEEKEAAEFEESTGGAIGVSYKNGKKEVDIAPLAVIVNLMKKGHYQEAIDAAREFATFNPKEAAEATAYYTMERSIRIQACITHLRSKNNSDVENFKQAVKKFFPFKRVGKKKSGFDHVLFMTPSKRALVALGEHAEQMATNPDARMVVQTYLRSHPASEVAATIGRYFNEDKDAIEPSSSEDESYDEEEESVEVALEKKKKGVSKKAVSRSPVKKDASGPERRSIVMDFLGRRAAAMGSGAASSSKQGKKPAARPSRKASVSSSSSSEDSQETDLSSSGKEDRPPARSSKTSGRGQRMGLVRELHHRGESLKKRGRDPLGDAVRNDHTVAQPKKRGGKSRIVDDELSSISVSEDEDLPQRGELPAPKKRKIAKLQRLPTPTKPKKKKTSSGGGGKRRAWTNVENANLVDGVKRYGVGAWRQILDAYDFDNRTNVQLKDRWRNITKEMSRQGSY